MNKWKRYRQKKWELGECLYSGCHKGPAPGRNLCAKHLKIEAKTHRVLYYKKIAQKKEQSTNA